MDLNAINILQPFNNDGIASFLAILISCVWDLAIGYERTSRNKQAGVKTTHDCGAHSCLMMIISKEAFLDTHITIRLLAAQVVSGISFIGGESFSCVKNAWVD